MGFITLFIGYTFFINSILSSEEISSGEKHSAVLSGSNIQTWGNNSFSQLGHNNSIGNVQGSQTWISISSGSYHNLALDDSLNVWAWGRNESGQLGLNDKTTRSNPVQVNTHEPIIELEAGARNSFLIGVSGNLYSVGDGSKGLLGHASNEELEFTAINLNSKVVSISSSETITVCADEEGLVWSWGESGFSQTPGTITPSLVSLPEKVYQVKAGSFHTLALASSGNLYGWGKNNTQQLGSGPSIIENAIVIETNVLDFDAGREHSLILTSTELKAIGRNQVTQLGTATLGDTEGVITNISSQNIVSSGPYENLTLNNQAELFGWGHNDQGQLIQFQSETLAPQSLGISPLLSYESNSPVSSLSSGNITLSLEIASLQSHSIQTSVIFAPYSPTVFNSSSVSPIIEIGHPGTYVFLTEITQNSSVHKRITKLFVRPSAYGNLKWGDNTWNQGNQASIDLR